ncbi:FixH family protein [Actinokineospora enzanensis]|uniref:FixH family protein n=1 Tax=Actinokineospora enzanensis TaxID=155975 RepID=UPI00036E934A|nr:FixH family protein [Actinokineospora enzanensis]
MTTRTRWAFAGVAAVLVVGLAVLLWPSSGRGVDLRASAGDYALRLTVDDPRVGANTVRVEVTDQAGGPVAADEVTVEPVMADMGHALAPVTATPDGPGRYTAAPTDLPMAGLWELTVTVRRDRTSAHAVFTLVV